MISPKLALLWQNNGGTTSTVKLAKPGETVNEFGLKSHKPASKPPPRQLQRRTRGVSKEIHVYLPIKVVNN